MNVTEKNKKILIIRTISKILKLSIRRDSGTSPTKVSKYLVTKYGNFKDVIVQFTDNKWWLTGKPVVISEWGVNAEPKSSEGTFNRIFISWLKRNCLTNNVSMHSLTSNVQRVASIYNDLQFYSSLTTLLSHYSHIGGLLEHDWKSPVERKLKLLNDLQPNPTNFVAHDNGLVNEFNVSCTSEFQNNLDHQRILSGESMWARMTCTRGRDVSHKKIHANIE